MKQRRNLVIRLCIVVLTLLSVVGAVFVGAATRAEAVQGPVCYNHGDVNADGAIDSRDAVYTLYHYLFGEEEYPVQQDLDFNKDTSLDSRDAIYVLCAYNFRDDPNYQLDGIVHNYYEPTWQWENNTAVATFKCGCGQVAVLGEADGVQVRLGTHQDASCVQAGFDEYVAEITLNGKTYTNINEQDIPARFSGHDMVNGSCTEASYCRNCDYTAAATGHRWLRSAELSAQASCTTDAVRGYRCANCNETMQVVEQGTASHMLEYSADVAMGNCQFVKQYTCVNCNTTFNGTAPSDTYYVHTYKATLTQEATCARAGVKTYTCQECGDSYNIAVEKNASHNWDGGVVAGGITTYSCQDCGTTKTAVTVAADESVSKESLGAAQELQLSNDTAVSLDDKVVENLEADRDIKISVDAIDLSEVQIDKALTQEQKDQIGDNPVYDFNMVYADNNDKVDFNGTVTVSLPYTLQPGEDIDSIDVWYIADDGSLERVDGTYSNGYVTFTTDHFSYYTVTRLTAAQRCERYGHIPVASKKAATCTEDGYEMSVCQRCGEELAKEVFKRTLHLVTVKQTDATCDTAGYVVETCKNCNRIVERVVPATGHNVAMDTTASVAATCKAAGKNVYTCTNGDCTYTREEILPQLSHEYFSNQYAPPTCDSKGIHSVTCRLCGEVFVVAEEAPLGHNFTADKAVWAWSKDYSSATVTLYCENNDTHVHTLNAVVTEKQVTGNCVEPAGITYTASASINNAVYQDVIVVEGTAPGHTVDTQWSSDSKYHYHVCTACGEQLDKASHNWKDVAVIQAATCAQPGKKIVKCSVCELEQERVIAATGKHAYVDGICSACGHDASSCDHLILRETDLDLSGYNVCSGTVIGVYGCECKQKARVAFYNMSCKLGDPVITEKVLPNGETYVIETYSCSVCDLVVSGGFYSVLSEDPCQRFANEEYSVSVGDTQILQCKFEQGVEMHPCVNEQSVIELTREEYGLCDVVLSVRTCPCGEQTATVELDGCNWSHEGYFEENGINTWRYHCYNCNATKINQDWVTPVEGTCDSIYTDVYTYYVNDLEVYSYTNTAHRENHNYEITHYEMQGETCYDGVLYEGVCVACGNVAKEYITDHEPTIRTEIDLSAADICIDALVQMTCPCGAFKEFQEVGQMHCQWGPWEGHDGSQCVECGATIVSVSDVTKDEFCEVTYNSEHTFADRNGNVLARVYNTRMETAHSFQTTYNMLGTSCTDGVEFTRECPDCGICEKWTNYDHVTDKLTEYYLPDYGMCEGYYWVYGCPCGENYWYEPVFSCNYDNGYGDQYWEEIYCSQCGVSRRNYWEPLEQIDQCHVIRKEGYAFYKDGELLLDGTIQAKGSDHDNMFTTTLMNEAGDCNDGVYVTATCRRCGTVENWETWGHEPFTVSREVYGEGVLCGPVEIWEYSCACGLESGKDMGFFGEKPCEFGPGTWSEELGSYVSTCYVCGAKRTEYEVAVPVEGQSCTYLVEEHIVYYTADGAELFNFIRNYTSTRHNWNTTFRLVGTTCEDGYYISRCCEDCGYSAGESELQYGCSWYDIESELVCQDENACGPVYMVLDGCACGAKRSVYLRSDCSFRDAGYNEKLQMHTEQCISCGLKYAIRSDNQGIEGSCDSIETIEFHFMRDEQIIASAQKSYMSKQHNWVCSFELYGSSCDDGYSVINTCRYCGFVQVERDCYGHETHRVASYDIGDYGLCGGDDAQIRHYSCACGRYSHVSSEIHCDWHHTGNVDPDTGASEYYCQYCNSYFYYRDVTELDPETCRATGWYYARWVRNGETLFTVEAPISHESHVFVMTGSSLDESGGSCMDQHMVMLTCKYCGRTEERYEGGYHATYRKQFVDLNEMGACGGELVLWKCACGERSELDSSWNCRMSYHEENTGDHRNGTSRQTRVCEDCGLTVIKDLIRSTPEGSCYGENAWTVTITLGDKTETLQYRSNHDAHSYYRSAVEFDVPGGDCEGGYTAYMTCKVCGDTYSYHSEHHNHDIVESVNIADLGGCQGEFVVRSCACGEFTNFEYQLNCNMSHEHESEGNAAQGYELHTRICTECGLKIEERRTWNKPENTCKGVNFYQITFTMGDVSRYIEFNSNYESHDYEYTYALKPGSVSCTDGLYAYAACIYCGDGYTSESYSHNRTLVESIDLVKYGSVCGGTLDRYACLCGAEQCYEFSEGAGCCDFDREWTEMWIENDLNAGQDTSEGWQSCHTNSYIYTCAVTDPACGMRIRMADYWLKEGCTAKRYQTWQLGYDPATGKCLYEFTIATGEECGYHDYSVSTVDEMLADGTSIYGNTWVCNDCGSYRTHKTWYLNDIRLKYEDHRVNMLDNGENKEQYWLYEYDYELGLRYHYDFQTRSYDVTVYADGSSYTYEHRYQYDFTNGCRVIHTYTNSNGEDRVNEYEEHKNSWSRVRTQDPTCTQHGVEVEKYECVVCGKIDSIEYYEVEPTAHDWHWNYEEQIYYCGTCGLENVNGSSGSIALEDLSQSHGNGTQYVIGYWNRNDIDFGLYVSLIPEGADGDSEIILEGIDFTHLTAENDGIRAISFGVEQVENAVASSGYTGEYDIRIVFVPRDGYHDLDYAITLTNQTAQ